VPTSRITSGFFDPVVVALSHHRRQRLLRNDVGENVVIGWLRKVQPQGVKLGDVGGEGVALAGLIGLEDLVQFSEFHLLILHIVGTEVIGEIELGRCAVLHANLAAVERQR
jgi:hypothetical protein